MIQIHHLHHSRSQRILWLLDELGLDYEVVRYQRDPDTMLAPQSLFKVHPLGKSPVLTDGDITVAESGAIIEYILEVYGKGRLVPPLGTQQKRDYVYWLHFAEGSGMFPLLLSLIFQRIKSANMPFFAKPIAKAIADNVTKSFVQPNLERQLQFIEATLSNQPWFAGETFTAADIQMGFVLESAAGDNAKFSQSYPSISKFIEKIKARDAYQRALVKTGDESAKSPFKQ
jgi:glutathione S-transferase